MIYDFQIRTLEKYLETLGFKIVAKSQVTNNVFILAERENKDAPQEVTATALNMQLPSKLIATIESVIASKQSTTITVRIMEVQ